MAQGNLPAKLREIELIRLNAFTEENRRTLWEGLTQGKIARGDEQLESFALSIEAGFLDDVVNVAADPEPIAFFVKTAALDGKESLEEPDAEGFSDNAVTTWLRKAWAPSIRKAYGTYARVFYSLARFLQSGLRGSSPFYFDSLPPSREYHTVFGPPLCTHFGETAEGYLPVLEAMAKAGNIRLSQDTAEPMHDFLLQAETLPGVDLELPSADWFAEHVKDLSEEACTDLARCFSSAAQINIKHQPENASWLYGWGTGKYIAATNTSDAAERERLFQEAAATCDMLVRYFGDTEELTLREQVAIALANKGLILNQMEKPEEAIAAYEDLIIRFGDTEELALRKPVAMAFLSKGYSLGQLERSEEAIAAYEDLIKRFGDAEELALREQIAVALGAKGETLQKWNKPEEAIDTFEVLIIRFGDAEDLVLKEYVALAFLSKIYTFRQLARMEEAIAAYDDLISRFGDAEELALREPVAKAHNSISNVFISKYHNTGEESLLGKALDSARRAASMGGRHYNLACVLALSGKTDEAFDELEGCLDRQEILWSHVDGDPEQNIEADRDWENLQTHPRYLALKVKYGSRDEGQEE